MYKLNTFTWLISSPFQDGFRFDETLIDDRGKVDGTMNYQPRTDPFDGDSEPVKTQLSRLTSKRLIHVFDRIC